MLAIFVLALIPFINGEDLKELCEIECHPPALNPDPCKLQDCDPLGKNCCRNKTTNKIMIDLRGCGLKALLADAFLQDPQLQNQTDSVSQICLNENPIGPHEVSVDTFRGLTGLNMLVVPSEFGSCPGGDDSWTDKRNETSALWCRGQIATCTHNVSAAACPDKSHCVNDGPGLMRCECNDGFYGYKCLKSGKFPYAVFYGSLGAATVVTSALLWFVGRRQIGLHSKQS